MNRLYNVYINTKQTDRRGGEYMSDEKRNLIRDVTTQIDKLPEDKKHYILGYMAGVIDCNTEACKDQKDK